MSIYGCFEMTIGFNGDEIVDFITYETDGTFRCYEIKTSVADLRSKSRLSFVGHYNYLVMPDELYRQAVSKRLTAPHYAGIITSSGIQRKPKKRQVSLGMQVTLLESMVRSLAREQTKYRDLMSRMMEKGGK